MNLKSNVHQENKNPPTKPIPDVQPPTPIENHPHQHSPNKNPYPLATENHPRLLWTATTWLDQAQHNAEKREHIN